MEGARRPWPRGGEARAGAQPEELAAALLCGEVGAADEGGLEVRGEVAQQLQLGGRVAERCQPRDAVGQAVGEGAAQRDRLRAVGRRDGGGQRRVVRKDLAQQLGELRLQLVRLFHHLWREAQRRRRVVVSARRPPGQVRAEQRDGV